MNSSLILEQQNKPCLDTLWQDYEHAVAVWLSAMIPNHHDAEDVLQTVAEIVSRKFDQYDAERPFYTWVLGISQYEVLKYRRRQCRDRHVFSDELMDRMASRSESIGDEVNAAEDALHDCIHRLHGRARRAVYLCYQDGMKPMQVADELQATPHAVRNLLSRARAALRDCVSKRAKGGEAAR